VSNLVTLSLPPKSSIFNSCSKGEENQTNYKKRLVIYQSNNRSKKPTAQNISATADYG
jgi:hypothetical protein